MRTVFAVMIVLLLSIACYMLVEAVLQYEIHRGQ
jgi:hypothetical protein